LKTIINTIEEAFTWKECMGYFRILILAGVLVTSVVNAQELLFLGGLSHEGGLEATSYAWSVDYNHSLGENTYLSLGWFNEGHLGDHHRDGPATQLWGRVNFRDRRLSLAVGLGPYAYFDTQLAAEGVTYANDHGFGLIYSAGLSWYSTQRWLLQLRINHIATDTPIDTTNLLFGVGYQLEAPSTPGPRPYASSHQQNTTRNELTLFAGQTILNSFQSENSTAYALEYRRGLGPFVDWTLGWLHEGGNHIIRRNGATTQLWLVRPFLHDRLALGAGAGAYFVVNKEHLTENTDDADETISAIISLTASYRLNSRWLARLSWNRIATDYSRDTDVILVGGGYRF
jgi:hypothetical protein